MSEPIDKTEKSPRVPWNKGKLIGAKPPLRSKHVWSIRTRLHVEGRTRDLAMFNLAIDSKLRGCDVVAIKVDDIAQSRLALPAFGREPAEGMETGRFLATHLPEIGLAAMRRLDPAQAAAAAAAGAADVTQPVFEAPPT